MRLREKRTLAEIGTLLKKIEVNVCVFENGGVKMEDQERDWHIDYQ